MSGGDAIDRVLAAAGQRAQPVSDARGARASASDAGLGEDMGLAPLRRLTPHRHSMLFPMMSEVEQAELEADIREHGQREPIVLFEGQFSTGGTGISPA